MFYSAMRNEHTYSKAKTEPSRGRNVLNIHTTNCALVAAPNACRLLFKAASTTTTKN